MRARSFGAAHPWGQRARRRALAYLSPPQHVNANAVPGPIMAASTARISCVQRHCSHAAVKVSATVAQAQFDLPSGGPL